MRVEKNISSVDASTPMIDTAVIETPVIETPVLDTQVIDTPVTYATAAPLVQPVMVPMDRHVETVRVRTESTLLPAAITGGLFSILLLVFGGVVLARAGVSGPWDQPVVSVGGFTATSILGTFAAASGFVLLVASLARSRSAILLLAIIIGVVAVVAAIEPTMGHGALAV